MLDNSVAQFGLAFPSREGAGAGLAGLDRAAPCVGQVNKFDDPTTGGDLDKEPVAPRTKLGAEAQRPVVRIVGQPRASKPDKAADPV